MDKINVGELFGKSVEDLQLQAEVQTLKYRNYQLEHDISSQRDYIKHLENQIKQLFESKKEVRYREEIIDVIHKTIYQFFDVCGDNEEVPISDKDKLLLSVNKAICNNLKFLEQEPCDDVVSRQAVIDLVNAECVDLQDGSELWRSYVNDTVESIYLKVKDMPPVTLTRKKGKWIEEPNCWLRCSCCNSHYPHTSIYASRGSNYCPNCGAEMESEE